MDSAADPRIGTVLQGRYRVIEPIAQGGMGVVYRAERIGIERQVAIKFLHTLIGGEREAVARFEREAKAMSKLMHPHCVPVIDFGVHDEAPYIVMEYVQGRTLLDLIAGGPVEPSRALHIVGQVLSGLAHAHGQGIIHRDVKPANILLVEVTGTGDHARILDFGLAKLVGGPGASWSTAQTAVGTPSYMSPEQSRGEEADARADQYAIGVLLHELLTGKKPFYGKDPFDILKQHIHAEPPPLSREGKQFSRELEAVVRRTLAKQPGDRYASALELRDALTATPEGRIKPRPYSSASFQATTPIPVAVEARQAVRPDEAAVVERPRLEGEPGAARRGRRRRGTGVVVVMIIVAGLAFGGRWAVERLRGTGMLAGIFDARDAAWPGDADLGAATVAALGDAGEALAVSAADAASSDAAPADAGPPDAGPPDAGPPDAGPPDATLAVPEVALDAAAEPAGLDADVARRVPGF